VALFERPSEDGEHIGPYRIVKTLGRGGMGEVFLARDDALNRRVAIKRIRSDSKVTPTLRQRLLREAQAIVNLDHPAIVRVYHLQECAGDDCIVMEYIPGETLAETLKEGPLEPAFAVHLAEEIASGLAAAHEAGIIHRDLKAENIVVTPTKNAKILDFGLVKPIGITVDDPSLTATGFVVGTWRSMSPEQARGAETDERSDLFSFGVLLYEMLTGISPFQGSNALATLTKVVSEKPPCVDTLRPGLSPRLVALLYRLLDKDPAARPQTAAEVARELHAIAALLNPAPGFDPEETVSALPTGVIGQWDGGFSTPGPPLQPAVEVESTAKISPQAPRRRTIEIATLLALTVTLASAVFIHLWWPGQFNRIQRSAAPIRPPVHQVPPKAAPVLPPIPQVPDASDESHAALREIKQRMDAAETPSKREPRLDQIVQQWPQFLEARILAIDLELGLFQSTKDERYLDHADKLVRQANLDLDDPRLLPSRIKILLARRSLTRASSEILLLTKLDPRNPQIPELRARFAESNGQTEEALVKWEAAVNLNPSLWQNSLHFARLEQAFGGPHLNDARRRLEKLHTDRAENIFILQALAELELYYGNPKKAEKIYSALTKRQWSTFPLTLLSNLGAARVLLSDYDGAAKIFNQILQLVPDNIEATVNLADVEMARDHSAYAESLYNKAFEKLNWDSIGREQTPDDQMIRAQCLANIGKTQEAMKLAEETVSQHPNDAILLQTAAMVFTIAHDDQSLDFIERALRKGIQPRWFKLPAYRPLFDKPRFQQLVEGKLPGRHSSHASSY
jgi:serine/threonine-protein kinase